MKVIFGLTKVSSFSAGNESPMETIGRDYIAKKFGLLGSYCCFFVLKFIQIFSDRRGSPRAKINLMFLTIILVK